MDEITKRQLKSLVESKEWDAMAIFADLAIKKWKLQEVKADDQFNTTWNTAVIEGKVAGVKELLDSIEQLSHDL